MYCTCGNPLTLTGGHTTWRGWDHGAVWADSKLQLLTFRDYRESLDVRDAEGVSVDVVQAHARRTYHLVASAVALAGKNSIACPIPGYIQRVLAQQHVRLHARLYSADWLQRLYDVLSTPVVLRVRRGTTSLSPARRKALEAFGRNPEASGKIQTNMILGIAFTEAIAIYCLVVSLIIKFV